MFDNFQFGNLDYTDIFFLTVIQESGVIIDDIHLSFGTLFYSCTYIQFIFMLSMHPIAFKDSLISLAALKYFM